MKTKRIKRGQPIRVSGPGTVTIERGGAVIFRPQPPARPKSTSKVRRNGGLLSIRKTKKAIKSALRSIATGKPNKNTWMSRVTRRNAKRTAKGKARK